VIARNERGQVTIMIVTFVICLGLGISAVTDIAAAYLRRQAATSLADGAALSASDAAAAVAVYGEADDEFVAIDEPAAREAVSAYLRSIDAYAAYPGLHVDVSVDHYRITVVLTMPYELPVNLPGVRDATTIHAESTATMPIY
jgi:uncharacterized membrane protein